MKNSILFLIALLIGIIGTLGYVLWSQRLVSFTNNPSSTFYSLANAPSQSLSSTSITISGDVLFQSRTSDQAEPITALPQLQQGETLITQQNGKANIQFPNTISIEIDPYTHLNFIQTLPANMLIEQTSGTATYTNLGNTIPLSIKASNLLITVTNGVSTVSRDTANSEITVQVQKGSILTGFNDGKITHVTSAEEGNQLIFHTDTQQIETTTQ